MARFLVLYNTPVDIEAFEKHYHEVHIPLARKLPGLRRYTISHGVTVIRGNAPSYLVAELEWGSMDELKKAFQSPEGKSTAADVSGNLEKLSPGIQSMIFETEDVM